MTPLIFLAARTVPLRLVIFDCDGVIADSEGVSSRVTAACLSEIGWSITADETLHRFMGMALDDMMPVIEQELGRPVPDGWRAAMSTRFMMAMRTEVTAIPGAIAALDGVTALGLPWRIASNSSHAEMHLKFNVLGLTEKAAGRTHSAQDVDRAKPAPDLFLAAAAAEGVLPAHCVVIEDSLPGARAAAAAGMDCLGYAPHGNSAAMQEEGAVPFHSMAALPGLLANALRAG